MAEPAEGFESWYRREHSRVLEHAVSRSRGRGSRGAPAVGRQLVAVFDPVGRGQSRPAGGRPQGKP